MSDRHCVVVVEDDPQMMRFLETGLDAHGYLVHAAGTGREGLAAITRESPDVVVVDLGLPDMDGSELVARVREWSRVPVIVLSVRDGAGSKIAVLDLGADDYVTKPFDMGELLARIRAALRNRIQSGGAAPLFRSGDIEVDLVRRLVRRRGEEVRVSPREYDLLKALVSHAGMVVTHQMLLDAIWGERQADYINYLRIFIGRLRHKLEGDPSRPRLITTEPGVGYRLRILSE
ncbi:MAG: response regulator transcription factor [Alphaproteobacteria bacterium]|nr:response regulator transcription factor [Alphaproteobacteria bacterium]